MKSLKDILAEGVEVSSDFKMVNSVNAQGKPITRKVRAHRKTMNPVKETSEEKPDVLASIQKFVGRQYDEEVELDEVSKFDISSMLANFNKNRPAHAQAKVDTRTSAQRKAETNKMLSDRAAAKPKFKPQPSKPSTPEQQIKNQNDAMAKSYANHKRGQYVGDSYELEGDLVEAVPKVSKQSPSMGGASKTEYDDGSSSTNYDAGPLSVQQKKDSKGDVQSNRVRYNTGIDSVQVKDYASGVKKLTVHGPGEDSYVSADASAKRLGVDPKKLKSPVYEGQSASMRMFKALQKAKKQREEEEARKKENEKRALTPKTVKEGNGDYEKYAQNRAKGDLLSKEISGGSDSVKSKNSVSDSAKNVTSDLTTGLASKNPEHEKRYQEDKKKLKPAESEDSLKKALEHFSRWPESVEEAKDPREYDYEGDMAKTQLRSIIANSQAVHDMLKDTTNIAEWVQSKITKAEDYISTVADYMTAEVNEAKQEDDDEDYTKHHKLDPDSGVEADQHIHVQLKKAIDSTMKPYEVSFKNGKKHSVSSPVAKTIVTAIEKLKPEHRKAAHDELHKSYDSLMAVHKAIVGK